MSEATCLGCGALVFGGDDVCGSPECTAARAHAVVRESVFKATVEACARTACCHPPKPHYTGVQACCRHGRDIRALTLEDISK